MRKNTPPTSPPHPSRSIPSEAERLSAKSGRDHEGVWRRGGGGSGGWGERSSPHPPGIVSPPPAGFPRLRELAHAGGAPLGCFARERGGGSTRAPILPQPAGAEPR